VAPPDISSVPTKQRGKKNGKRTVNLADGFASVSREQFGYLLASKPLCLVDAVCDNCGRSESGENLLKKTISSSVGATGDKIALSLSVRHKAA
jgi:hypothetical protein